MSRHITPRLTTRAGELLIDLIDEHWGEVFERYPQHTWRDHDACDDVCHEVVSDAYCLSRAKDALDAALEDELREAS